MPNLRLAFTHTPVGGKTRKELDAYIAGEDPVTRQPFMREIVDYLTRPLNDEEKKTGLVKREKKRLIGPDTADNIQRYFNDRFGLGRLADRRAFQLHILDGGDGGFQRQGRQ